MDTEEMSRRGTEDAELGEPNPFYYQHYYHYRRSFDRIRRQQRSQAIRTRAGFVVAFIAAIAGATALLFVRMPTQPTLSLASTATMTVVATITPKPLFPTPTVVPIEIAPETNEVHSGLQLNGFAVVSNTAGKSLRARSEPNLQAQIQASFREGERVQVLEGPVEADNLRWWRVEGAQGSGWSAELSPNGDTLLTPSS